MPASVVKTPKDEKLWNKAKKIAKKKNLTKDRNWAYTMGTFQDMKGEGEEMMLQDQELNTKELIRTYVAELISCSSSSSSSSSSS